MKIDITKKLYYNGINDLRTKKRLNEMIEIGMQEVGYGQFGIPNIMSGLYIERVWSYNNMDFKDYIDWVKDLTIKTISSKKLL